MPMISQLIGTTVSLTINTASAHHRNFADVVTVTWKAPTLPYVKVNTNSYVIGESAACGGIFCDYRGSFVDCFACKLDGWTIFEAELYDFALDYAIMHHWKYLWAVRDSQSALMVFLELFSGSFCIVQSVA
jgi:hypothetical protein